MLIRWLTGLSLLTLGACATVPEPLEGDYSQSFYPAQATENSVGARVRWGGSVVETTPEAKRTCVEILAHPLGSTSRPTRSDEDLGRFLACRDSFIDPEIFAHNREVTVVGRLNGFRSGRVGEFAYEYPVIDAEAVYLWPERTDLDGYGYGHGYHRTAYWWPYYHYPFRRHPLFFGRYYY